MKRLVLFMMAVMLLSITVNAQLIYQNYFCIYNYFIFKTLTILQT